MNQIKHFYTSRQFIGLMQRGQVLALFADFEYKMKMFILNEYSTNKELAEKLEKEIFNDQYFSFSLLKSVFKTALERHADLLALYTEKSNGESSVESRLSGLYDFRNIAAHSPELENPNGEPTLKWVKPGYPPDETTSSVNQRFIELYNKLIPFFEQLSGVQENISQNPGTPS